jgi:hypothetical protein
MLTHIKFRLLISALVVSLFITGCTRSDRTNVAELPSPALAGSAEAHLARGPDGTVVLSWLEPTDDGVALRYATHLDDAWSEPRTVAQGADWFVNWADFPSVVPLSETLWAAHWLAKTPGGSYAYDVALAVSSDRGESWSASMTPHTDGTRTEHGFVSLFPWHGGVGALWLDGRNMIEDGDHTGGVAGHGMTLRTATVSANGELADEQLIDELVCDCCQTDVALAATGPIAVYRNRTTAEIRDIYVARHIDESWQAGEVVADDGWEISGCPVNGPAIIANDRVVGVAWFTAANGHSRVRAALSTDAGATFSNPVDVDAERAIGRVDVAMLDDGALAVSWLRRGLESQGEIVVRRVAPDGTLGLVSVVAKTMTSRPTGFPQMVRDEEALLFAWTHIEDGQSTIRTAQLNVSALNTH